jgi:hypothetical protein
MLFSRFAAERAQRQLASIPIHAEPIAGQSSIPTGTRSDRSSQPRWRRQACTTQSKNSRRPTIRT